MNEAIQEPRLMRPAEVCRRLGISPRTLSRWQSERANFPRSFRIGENTVVFDGSAIDRFIEQRMKEVA